MVAGVEPGVPGIGGVVELREDVPLKGSSGGGGGCAGWGEGGCGGPRGVIACFAALSAGITLALLVQVYAGGGGGGGAEGAGGLHGAVAAGGGVQCSRVGTDALRAGGGALDAAAVAALCLALAAPHATSLDASGAMLVWQYRSARDKPPLLVRWGAQAEGAGAGSGGPLTRRPRLVCALAALHAGARAEGTGAEGDSLAPGVQSRLAWRDWIQPAINIASTTVPVSAPLQNAAAAAGRALPPSTHPRLLTFLKQLQNFTSAELSEWCGEWGGLSLGPAAGARAGHWQVWGAGGAVGALQGALLAQGALDRPEINLLDPFDAAIYQAASSLNESGAWRGAGAASGLAVIDSTDTYVALVTGLSQWFGSGSAVGGAGGAGEVGGEGGAEGWTRDDPAEPLDLAPAMLLEDQVCGTRYVMGAESSAALSQAGAALVAGGGTGAPAAAVERARLGARGGVEQRSPPAPPPPPALAALSAGGGPQPRTAPPPYAAVNLVQQRGDTLASHADSRAAGLASRF